MPLTREHLEHLARTLERTDHALPPAVWAELLRALNAAEYGDPPPPPCSATTGSRRARFQLLVSRQRLGWSLWHPGDMITLGRPWGRSGIVGRAVRA
jgi:hypothetical protein